MQEILFSKKPLVYLNNISGCNQLWGYLKTSLPIITEVIITSPYGHTFYSGTTGKYRYQQFAKKILQDNKNMSREPFFLTIPPGDDSNQLPQLVYCFPVYNTLLPGYISNEYALGMALIDINALVDLTSSEKYVGEIKAILYHDNIVYISREASQLEMSALYKRAQGKFRIDNVEFACHTVMLEDIGMSMIDMVPTANLLQSSAQIRIIATTVLLGTCACLIFSTWLIQHYISVPINQMIADMQDIQAGIRKSLTLPNLSDLRYLTESINQTLNVLDISNRRQLEMSHRKTFVVPINDFCQPLQCPRLIINDYNSIHKCSSFPDILKMAYKKAEHQKPLLMLCLSFLVIGTPAYQLEWISFCVCRTIKQNIIREFHHHMQVAGRFDLFA